MAEQNGAVDIDPKELENAEAFWHNFILGAKYIIIGTAVVLIGLALAFVKFF